MQKPNLDFRFGDLIVKCHQCGYTEVMESMVTDGRAVYLFNKNDSYLKLHCPKCDITMEMRIQPTANVDEPDELEKTKEDEKLSEDIAEKETV